MIRLNLSIKGLPINREIIFEELATPMFATINAINDIVLTTSSTNPSNCTSADGTVTVMASGGTAPYTFLGYYTNGLNFVTLNSPLTNTVYGSYVGGNVSAEHVDGGTSRFDRNGIMYQSVCAGCGFNSDFPSQ